MFNEGLDDAGAAERVRSHHQHLILVHRVEERPHVGSDGLQRHNKRR